MIQQGNLLEPSLNPPHDTKHGNKTTCITVQIHRMILDMVLTEVYRSIAPLEELDGTIRRTRKLARGRFVVKLFDPYYKH
jgi:hypothetical protein